MSFSGIGSVTATAMPFDYLQNGPGLQGLQDVASGVVAQLLTGKAGYVSTPSLQTNIYVPADPLVPTIFNGHETSAKWIGGIVVNTLVRAEREKPASSRRQVVNVAYDVVTQVARALHNNGDPSGCLFAFESSFQAWQALASAVAIPGGWAAKDIVFPTDGQGNVFSCRCLAVAKLIVGTDGVNRYVTAAAPSPADTRPAVTAGQPPPTHAQIDAATAAKLAASGQSFDQMEKAQELTELAGYLDALAHARTTLTLGLGLPSTAPDAKVWAALQARGISAGEAVDWFLGCDADLTCFRENMNAALGESDARASDSRAKVLAGVGILGVVALAFFAYRGAR
jgi:predicted ATPase